MVQLDYMRKVQFINDCLYHVYNRGTEKRKIFLEEKDYFRFIHDLYEFNDVNAVLNLGKRFEWYRGSTSIHRGPRELLVEIIAFCLMPNHFHLILRQLKEGGIVKFMQKLGTGYTMYFNQKNQRTGALFQGKFKAILVDKDEYFLPLVNYIHLNPVELIEPNWKEEGIKAWGKVNEFLGNYRWSSYPDYIGIKNFPSVINKNFLINYYKDEQNYKKYLMTDLARNLDKINKIKLD
jgi:putative transposase